MDEFIFDAPAKRVKDRLLLLIPLKDYGGDFYSMILCLNSLLGSREPWFDVIVISELTPPSPCEANPNFSLDSVICPSNISPWVKPSLVLSRLKEYRYVLYGTVDDLWHVDESSFRSILKDGKSHYSFNFILGRPIPEKLLLVWRGWNQITAAAQVSDPNARVIRFSGEGVPSMFGIYQSEYLVDLLRSVLLLESKLSQVDPRFLSIIEDFMNVSNLAVPFAVTNSWCLRFVDANYEKKENFMLSAAVIQRLNAADLLALVEAFFSPLRKHYLGFNFSISVIARAVLSNALAFAQARSRIWRTGIDLLLDFDSRPAAVRVIDRKHNPVLSVSSGLVKLDDLPSVTGLRDPVAIEILNMREFFLHKQFSQWTK